MTPATVLSLASLTLFSLADLRYRVAPGTAIFFLIAAFLSAPHEPLRVSLVVLSVGWGLLHWPAVWIIPALVSPSTWAVSLIGAGVRGGMVGQADLFVLGGLACLFDWPATVFAFVGVEVWRRFWEKRRYGNVPALPGIFLGFVAYWLWWFFIG